MMVLPSGTGASDDAPGLECPEFLRREADAAQDLGRVCPETRRRRGDVARALLEQGGEAEEPDAADPLDVDLLEDAAVLHLGLRERLAQREDRPARDVP